MGARRLDRLQAAVERLRQLRSQTRPTADERGAGGAAALAIAWREVMAGLERVEAALVAEEPNRAVLDALQPLLLPPWGGAVSSFVRRVRPLPMAARVGLQEVLTECVAQLSDTYEPNWSFAREILASLDSFWREPSDELLAILEPTPATEQLIADVVEVWAGDEVPGRRESLLEDDVLYGGTLAPLAGQTVGALVDNWREHRERGSLARAFEDWPYLRPAGASYYLGAYLQASLEELLTQYEWPLCSEVCEHLQDPLVDYRWLPHIPDAKKRVIQRVLLRIDEEAPGAFIRDADRAWYREMVPRVWA